MKPQPYAALYSPWERKFAWRPVRSRSGKWLWLRTVLEREAQVSVNTINVCKIVKEYDTPADVIRLKLMGKE